MRFLICFSLIVICAAKEWNNFGGYTQDKNSCNKENQEEWVGPCAMRCEPTCQRPTRGACTRECWQGCQCVKGKGLVRNDDGKCIKVEDCPKN